MSLRRKGKEKKMPKLTSSQKGKRKARSSGKERGTGKTHF